MTDEYGFLDALGVFHDRYEAIPIAVEAGQLSKDWLSIPRELLSSDLRWDATPPEQPVDDRRWDFSSDARPRPEHYTPPKESRQVRRARERKNR